MLAALLAVFALAQTAGSIEGRVINSLTRAGLAGVAVNAGGGRVWTDSAGAFRIPELPPGVHKLSLEAHGFLAREAEVRVDSGASPARVDIEMTPESSISGRVLGEDGKSLAGVLVEITEAIRRTGTTWRTWGDVTDAEGYRVGGMPPGTYLAMVRPNPRVMGAVAGRQPRERALPPPPERGDGRRVWVRTFHPSVTERSQAATLVLRGGTHLVADIQLVAAPVYAVRGRVSDPAGRPVNAAVSLASPDPAEMPEAHARAHGGVFELPATPGEWRVRAEFETGGTKLRGSAPVLVGRGDVENVAVPLSAPFALQAFVEPALKGVKTIELVPSEAPAAGAAYSRTVSDSEFLVPAVYAGRYRINVYGTIPGHYLDAVFAGEQDALGKDVAFEPGAPPLRIVFKPDTSRLSGTVEAGAHATVVAMPAVEGLWTARFIRTVRCDASGRFEVGGLRPGTYYALALDRIASTGLDDLAILRRLAAMAATVQIDSGRTTHLDLKVSPWPE